MVILAKHGVCACNKRVIIEREDGAAFIIKSYTLLS